MSASRTFPGAHHRPAGRPPMALAFLATFLNRVLLAAAFFSLFFPLLGPALDQHFAERYPYHSHIFLHGGGGEHVHFYDLEHPHGHSHSHHAAESATDASSSPAEHTPGVIFLTSSDGAGHSITTLANGTMRLDIVYRGLDGDSMRPAFSSSDPYPDEALVPPPEKPPQA